ncbi:hypothetical protein FO519_008566 [Halicephalobus sp. NKZ332]|nr:hypothetical protein FO519_008566 [Halicephalobus sp. NKZ332]
MMESAEEFSVQIPENPGTSRDILENPQETSEDPTDMCVKAFLQLLQDPYKMCTLLRLSNSTSKAMAKTPEENPDFDPDLPRLLISLRSAFSNKEILTRATRHFQNMDDEQLYYLRSMMMTSRDIHMIVQTFIEDTRCKNPEGLKNLVVYMCDLIQEAVPQRFRLDKMLDMREEELNAVERKLGNFEGDYNDEDWLSVCQSYVKGGVNLIFDSSNITLSEVLREFSENYKEKIVKDSYECNKNSEKFRISDSPYQRAFEIADVPNYERIYQFLASITGCRSVSAKDLSPIDAAIIANIFQEMEGVIATDFDVIARQMPILRSHIAALGPGPITKFDEEEVNEVEFNSFKLPDTFKNMYEFEKSRRENLKRKD